MIFNSLPNTGKGRNRVSGFFYAFTLILLLAAFACTPAAADPVIAITACGTTISQPGHYILANDLSCGSSPVAPTTGGANPLATWGPLHNPLDGSTVVLPHPASSGDGIDIVADHVDLALNGHTIDGGGFGSNGILVGGTSGNAHVHIVGPGTVTGFGAGVFFQQVSFSSVSDVTATNNFFDFVLGGVNPSCVPACSATKNDFQGNTASNSLAGFLLIGANDNTLRDNNVSSTEFGILLIVGAGNDVRANTANGNGGGIVLGFFFGPGDATDNDITHNTAQNNSTDLFDENPNCDSNTWKHNVFGTANQACIN
jgi:parallel beta-helix repeat protein